MPEVDNTISESSKILETMATPDFTDELTALMKIRAPVVFLTCREEKRMLNYFKHLVVTRGFRASTWDNYTGMADLLTGEIDKTVSEEICDPDNALHFITKLLSLLHPPNNYSFPTPYTKELQVASGTIPPTARKMYRGMPLEKYNLARGTAV